MGRTARAAMVSVALLGGLVLTVPSAPAGVASEPAGHAGNGHQAGSAVAWSPQPISAPVASFSGFSSLACPDSSDCYAVGRGIALETHDGGGTWSGSTLPGPSPYLEAVACPSTATCVAAWSSPYQTGVALVTTDGGTTWTPASLPPAIAGFGDVACTGLQTCWAVGTTFGGTPVVTTTSGSLTTWKTVAADTSLSPFDSITCADTSDCAIAGFGTNGAIAAETTHDGGLTWTVDDLTASPSPGFSPSQGVDQVTCPTSQMCLVTWRPLGFHLGSTVFTTTDGGVTWTAHELPVGDLRDVACATPLHCWGVGSVVDQLAGPYPSSTGGVVVASTDGGVTWIAQALPAGTPSLSAISCPIDLTCRAVGTPAAQPAGSSPSVPFTVATTDGSTWTYQPLPAASGSMSSISCTDRNHCWAAGPATLAATDDGGATWHLQTVPPGTSSVSAISCTGNQVCRAIGQAADGSTTVVATDDGGAVWYVQATLSHLGLDAITCPTASTCWAVGTNETYGIAAVIATDDGGNSWSQQEVPQSTQAAALSSIACVNTERCWAVGRSATGSICGYNTCPLVLASADGGSTWVRQSLPAEALWLDSLTSISCTSTTSCWAVGVGTATVPRGIDSNVVLSTSDGGSTWSATEIPGFSRNVAIYCVAGGGTGGATGGATGGGAGGGTGGATGGVCRILNGGFDYRYYSPSGYPPVSGSALVTNAAGPWGIQTSPVPVGAVAAISCLDADRCWAVGAGDGPGATQIAATVNGGGPVTVRARTNGYWLATAGGGVLTYGGAGYHGSLIGTAIAAPVVAMASTPDGEGYWLASADGGVFAFGDAGFYGSLAGTSLAAPVTGFDPTADGRGYWLVGSDGGVFAFGDAPYFGNAVAAGSGPGAGSWTDPWHGPVVGIASSPNGLGYSTLDTTGRMDLFGDASQGFTLQGCYLFRGGPGPAEPCTASAVGAALTPDGGGQWTASADGGVFATGDALFSGSMNGRGMTAAAVGIAPASDGHGYWLASADGGVFAFGTAAYYGSAGNLPLSAPVVAIAAD